MKNKEKKKGLKERKENLIKSLGEVEHFLSNWKKAKKGIHLYKFLK